MNQIFTACILLAGVACALASSGWHKFKEEHGKVYEDPVEEKMRHSIFMKNKLEIERFNEQESREAGFKLGLNQLSDWTEEEFKKMLGFKLPQDREFNLTNSAKAEAFLARILGNRSAPLPDSVDWRTVPGRVTPVKNQGHCGSCWAFATTGALEGQELSVARRKDLIGLSEQYLVDCDHKDHACFGGLPSSAMDAIKERGGIVDDVSYPYTGWMSGSCKFDKSKLVMTDSGHALLEEGNENMLKEVVAKFGPVAVGMDASAEAFMFYERGVLKTKFCRNDLRSLNHGVLVVGYGTTEKGVDYWLVKNSWSTKWGDGGYFKLARNSNNMCGLATMGTIPTFD